ncbi:MAG: DUF2076 family protein [Acidisphaera sp.]|nr:DUF2076 family protein [Acidisphaera sp.]MBV9811938.1 DUF2076 family protein [Acetobacteraceae bacterium]
MTNEERDLITQFIARVGGAPQQSGFSSVPSTATSAQLPPVDREADALLADLFQKYPEARYRITQLAFVQEHALTAAQQRINELQAALAHAQQAQQGQGAPGGSPWGTGGQPQQAPGQSRGFLSSLFGGGSSAPPPPRPAYAPPPQQQAYQQAAPMPAQMMGGSGNGFLGGALRTAAGVAGGVVAGEALMNLFSGGHGGGLFGGANYGGGPTTIIEEGSQAGASPWGAPDPNDAGGAMKDTGVVDNAGWTDTTGSDQSAGGWTDTSNQDSGWTDASNQDPGWTDTSGGGGWDDTSNSGTI